MVEGYDYPHSAWFRIIKLPGYESGVDPSIQLGGGQQSQAMIAVNNLVSVVANNQKDLSSFTPPNYT